ncbi:MAG: MaoC family dehydratase [Methyloligellaceae bacterium]
MDQLIKIAESQHGYFFEDLQLGQEASHSKVIEEQDIQLFADLSGDDNPVHLCDVFASRTIFKERIAHGILTASLLSTVIGTKLPGPGCIYVSQSLNFRAPVRIGDEVTATARIIDLVDRKARAIFACECRVGETTVLDGEAVIMVPRRSG